MFLKFRFKWIKKNTKKSLPVQIVDDADGDDVTDAENWTFWSLGDRCHDDIAVEQA